MKKPQLDPEKYFDEWWKTATMTDDDKGAALVGWVESYHYFKENTPEPNQNP